MTQKERQEHSRKEIFRAAMEQFGARDYETVTMESICQSHGISKGMMYHYFANKDELFLLCVAYTFQELKDYVEQAVAGWEEKSTFGAIQHFFLLRETYFQRHPRQKNVFENAMLRPPKHLAHRIVALHQPLREMNQQFLGQAVARMRLRPGLEPAVVAKYLECLEPAFRVFLEQDAAAQKIADIHAMFQATEQLLRMMLYGVVQEETGNRTKRGGKP